MVRRRKRGYGEGTIFKRKEDGIYVGRIPITDASGRRTTKTVYGKTYDEAAAKLDAIHQSLSLGLVVGTRDQTVAQFLAVWLEDTVKPHRAPRTYEDYSETVKRHIAPHIGNVALDKLTPQDVQRMITAVSKHVSPQMAMRCRRTLRAALTRAVKWGFVARNVASLTDAPKVVPREMVALAPADARKLLDAVRGDRLEALYTVALALGLRQGEALGLRWHDVDLEGRTLTVRYQLQRIEGKPTLVEPKTPKSRRTLALPGIAVDALKRHRVRQLEERLWAGSQWKEGGYVFTSTVGTPVDEHNLRKHFRTLVMKAGLPHMRFHDLRHSAASLLAAQGANARDVMETLGHTQIATTMNLYTHVFAERKSELADLMDAALRGARTERIE